MAKRRVIIIGAGGFAREVAWLLQDLERHDGSCSFGGYVVSDLGLLGEHDSRDEVLGDLGWLHENRSKFDALAIGIGTPSVRLAISDQLAESFSPEWWPAFVHPSVQFDRSCLLAHGVLLCAGTIATVNVRFEPYCMLNLMCTVGHEATIGVGSVLNPTVNISGGVSVGKGVLIGTGAQVLQYVKVGDGATVGAGAVATKDVPAGQTVVGIPAKVLSRG